MKDIDAVIKWYEQNRPIYESLAKKVEDIIKENLEQNKIQYHSVSSRGKSIKSYIDKAKNEKYTDPIKEINDMAGIRVITYLESDVNIISDIVEELFEIDKENSLDQSQLLGSDKLGYRSVHYVACFDNKRCNLPEYKPYKGLSFEIQIRSILQHAWAEIEHDRNYKFSGKLPTKLQRRFYLISGMLECADREFVSIAQDIEKYKESIVEDLKKGELDIEINTTSLVEYINKEFKELINKGLLRIAVSKEASNLIVEELNLYGIRNIGQLDKIIPINYQKKALDKTISFGVLGCLRDILIINDAKKYFKLCWRKSWKEIGLHHIKFLEAFNLNILDFEKYLKERDISIKEI